MALVKCKECNHEISTNAKICPNCGYEDKPIIGLGGTIFLIFLVVLIFASFGNDPKPPQPANQASKYPPTAEELKYQAKGACLISINSVLHDPDSADIDSLNAKISVENGIYKVQLKVRANNKLGAKVLNIFECKLIYSPNGWTTMSVKTL